MNFLTVRNIPPELARALREEKQRRGVSLNRLVLELLSQALGLGWPEPGQNGLQKLAGDWTQKDFEDFETATAVFEKVDEELSR